jgi:hypothetical protein
MAFVIAGGLLLCKHRQTTHPSIYPVHQKNLSLRQFKSLLGVGNTLGFANAALERLAHAN